ncbi:MAG: hypothetical protein LDL13_00265 [Calditerrivibrio sp.]|nr:hypothetical protein [Calditerrivibrio sp.]MCA1980167.1 hypothetical protein [Calditerrivibrio sp.]
MKTKFLVIAIILTISYSCSTKSDVVSSTLIQNDSDNSTQIQIEDSYNKELEEAIKKINEASPTICSYKDKVIFEYKDEKIKVKMRGSVEKDCDNNGEINIFGPFGVVLYNATYVNGVLNVKKDNESVLFTDKNIKKIEEMVNYIYLFNYPGIRPTKEFHFYRDGENFTFKKDNVTIYATKSRIERIDIGNIDVRYTVSSEKIKDIVILRKDNERYLRVIFE